MSGAMLAGTSLGRLRLVMALFFLALAIPTAVLVVHAHGQLKWETFHQYRQLAEEASRRIDRRLARLLAAEEARGFDEYRFVLAPGGGRSNVLQRSPLSAFPVRSEIPGLIGWFQVDADGVFSSPLVPRTGAASGELGLDAASRAERVALEGRIHAILGANRLVGSRAPRAVAPGDARSERAASEADAAATAAAPYRLRQESNEKRAAQSAYPAAPAMDQAKREAPAPALASEPLADSAQSAFDQLSSAANQAARRKQAPPGKLGRVDDLKLSSPYAESEEQARKDDAPVLRKEKSAAVPLAPAEPARARGLAGVGGGGAPVSGEPPRVLTFAGEIDPLEFNLLDSGHFVLYRKVWREGQRYIQGALIEREPFLEGLVEGAFEGTALARMSDLVVAWQGDVFAAFSGDAYRSPFASTGELTGALLYRTRLSAPLADMELVFSVTRLPAGPGARVLAWTAGVFALVLVLGTWLMYRLGARQIALARQQQDFVSAVSHELRTPITSIRMYAEMLREGWASEEKKRGYYEFIVQESERLSRLIANVLQLARMTRNDHAVQLQDVSVSRLMDDVQSKIASQVQHAGFELGVKCDDAVSSVSLRVDPDAFSQCLINLVDNALKFSAGAARKVVEVGCRLDGDGHVSVTVRDHGPGVARDQMKKIFTLFYRSENELTRETVGTGIGLALVHQLMRAMHGQVDVANVDPGALFTLRFPVSKDAVVAGG